MPFDRNHDEPGLGVEAGDSGGSGEVEPKTVDDSAPSGPTTSTAGPGRPEPPRRAPLALAAAVTTLWAALVSLLPVLVLVGFAYAVDSAGASVGRMFSLGMSVWLLVHGVPVHTDGGPIGLPPLVITAFAGWRVLRAGVHTARAVRARRARTVWPTLAAAAAVGAVYGLLGTAAALAVRMPGITVSPIRAGVTLALFAAVTGLAGAATESGAFHRACRGIPLVVRDGVRTGTVAGLLLLGAGAAAGGMALALAGGEASQILADYETGLIGQIGLTVVCLMYIPTVSVWAASYLVGPGFSVGAGTTVSAAKVTLGPLPALPLLAGLPTQVAGSWGALLLGLPLAAGMVAGWLLVRREWRQRGSRRPFQGQAWGTHVTAAVIAGPVAGVVLALASMLSTGPLGDGRLATVGPRTLPVAIIGAGIVSGGALLGVVATRLIITRRQG